MVNPFTLMGDGSDGGTITAPVENPKTRTESAVDLPWNVIVYNDPINLMSFVTYALRKVFGDSEEKATVLMMEVHTSGKSIVWTGAREKAELYVQQLQGLQLLAVMKQSA
jgi:ATP-dependent Clp protease adaptor protein ClpS